MIQAFALCLLLILNCFAVAANDSERADLSLKRGDNSDAVSVLEKLAQAGDPTAMVRLAARYQSGEGVRRDVEEAAKLYLSAAKLGNAEAQFNLGNMYLLGEGLAEDHSSALAFYRLASKQGHASATANMEQMIRAGVDFRESDDLFADSASVDADRGGDRNQDESGITRISSTNELQHTSESNSLATNSENLTLKAGESQSEPVNQAFTRDELAALKLAQKHGIRVDLNTNPTAPAQKAPVFIVNEHAREAPVADDALRKRFEKAQVSLQQDQEQGLAALKELAAEGHADSAMLLAELASRDESSTKNPGDVTAWLLRAAVLGNTEAQYRLGEQYMHGTRVVEDEAMAISFYRDAALGGHKLAREKLRAIYARAGLPTPALSRPPNRIVPATRIGEDPLSVESHDDEDSVGDSLHSRVDGDPGSGGARAPANVAERVANTETKFSVQSSGIGRPNTLGESVRVTLETTATQKMSPSADAAEATVVNLARDSFPINPMNEVGIRLGRDLPSVETAESPLFGDRYPTDLMFPADHNMDKVVKLNKSAVAQRHLDARAELTSQINSGAL